MFGLLLTVPSNLIACTDPLHRAAMDKSKRLSRQSSTTTPRRSTCAISFLTSSACRFLMGVGVILTIGILFGVYLDGYFMWNRSKLLPQRPARDAVNIEEKEKAVIAKEKDKGRPGLSIKKDLSIQFRDYLPRHIFVDASLGPPQSLELFQETYPDAHKYTLYAFLADNTYKDVYAKFPKLNLYLGSVPSTSQKVTTLVVPAVGHQAKTNRSVPVSTVNFSTWLKENVHPDEYVIVKLTTDPKNEEQIVRQLVSTGVLEWIDKFYTTSSNNDVVEIAKERFSTRGNYEVFLWDDERFTYSDFDEVNPPRVKREAGAKIHGCRVKNKTAFALLLYASKMNKHAWASIDLLKKKSKKRASKLPLTLFLPLDDLQSPLLCSELSSLRTCADLGVYLQDSFFLDVISDNTDVTHNRIRNKFVSAENCFARDNLTLDYTLLKSEMLKTESLLSGRKDKTIPEDNKIVKKLISKRKYTIISNVRDVTPLLREGNIALPKSVRESSSDSLLALDISLQGADTFVLQLLTSRTTNLIPLHLCPE